MDIFYKKIKANVTPEVLAQLHSKKIILESTNQQQTKGRYSVVIFDIYGTLTLDNDVLSVSTLKESYQIIERPYHYLTTKINEDYHNIQDEQLKSLPFISGYVGTCSFDLVRHEFPKLQSIQLEDHKQHDVRLYMVEQVYVFDHYKDELYIIATNQFSNSTKSDLENRVNKSIEDLTKIQPFMPTQDFDFKTKEIQSNISEERFIEMIQYFKEKITEGDMFQVVPSRIYKYAHHASQHLNQLSFQLYQNLKRQNPSPYMYYLNIDKPYIVGSSPESFVSVKDQIVTTNPIAGTIQRGETTQIDNENMKQLLNDPKECSEHRMLVDLGRNDIHRVSKIGTSKITKLMVIEKYEHVMHIVSEITGKINQNLSPMTVIANLLPTGTVSGAPKLRAIERIYEQYPHKRGVYSGGVGYINCNHNLDFALAIRTMMIDEQYINVEAGCGVVYDSIPEMEAGQQAIKQGITIDYIFNQLEKHGDQIKCNYVLMTYYNIICHYGEQAFFEKCRDTGVYGLIIPDLPYELSQRLKEQFSHYGVKIISLVAMTTDDKRMKDIVSHAEGFIYTVTMNATTGQNGAFHPELKRKIESIKAIANVPVVAGFGIRTPQHVADIKEVADGIVIGSEIVKRFKSNTREEIIKYLQSIQQTLNN
ncbi:TPA: anthranilate synthase component I [Staphylococcus aureus]